MLAVVTDTNKGGDMVHPSLCGWLVLRVCVCVCDDGSNQNCSCAYSCRVMVCAFVIMSYNIDILGGAGGVLFARHFT